jgi:hypothetical protein
MPTPADTFATQEALTAGWEALATDWGRARTCFEAAMEREPSADALGGLSLAAWWLHDAETMLETRERAIDTGCFRRAHRVLEGAAPRFPSMTSAEHRWRRRRGRRQRRLRGRKRLLPGSARRVCSVRATGRPAQGRLRAEVGRGQAYLIKLAHGAWVVGDERFVAFEFESRSAEG